MDSIHGKKTSCDYTDHVAAEGLNDTRKYLSKILGLEVSDPAGLIRGMDEPAMRRILDANHVNGEIEGDITFYLCDISKGGGIKEIHAYSRTLRLEPVI